MSTDLETALRRALDSAGDIIGQPRDNLAERARGRHRRRTAFRGVGAAVLAMVVATTGGYWASRHTGANHDTVTGSPTGAPTPAPTVTGPIAQASLRLEVSTARPVRDVWPQALRTLPPRLPDGSEYNVLEEIGPGTFVVQANTGFERYGSVYRFQPANGELTKLIDARQLNPSTSRVAPVGKAWVLNGAYVAVQTLEAESQPSIVYVASVADGSRVAQVNLPRGIAEVRVMGWAEGHLIWSTFDDAVYSATDPAHIVSGSAGFFLIGQGAWAVAPGPSGIKWWNVATGERHEASIQGSMDACHGTSCLTRTATNVYHIVGLNGPTGKTAVLDPSYQGISLLPWGDHFVVVDYDESGPNRALLLWDLRTNTYASIPKPASDTDMTGSDMNLLVLGTSAREKVVISLTAID